jgi:hypothetical protein
MDTKQYLEYLNKEMTIMGILSGVSLAAPAGILNAVLSKDSGDAKTLLWTFGHYFIATGSVLCVLAAFLFYKERSRLAWYYGQICLTEALTIKKSVSSAQLRERLRDADSWKTWWPYSWGCTCLGVGFVEYLFAFFLFLTPLDWSRAHLQTINVPAGIAVFAVLVASVQWYGLRRYKFSDHPWVDFGSDILKCLWNKRKLPHVGVYTRLKPSGIHGVGVFAIKAIPKDTYMFEPEDDPVVSVLADETIGLPPDVRQLYEDFCVLNGDTYQCPSSLNKLTPAWFLNNSTDPNVAADSSLKFYAIRDIEAGEELTADYETYSENERRA